MRVRAISSWASRRNLYLLLLVPFPNVTYLIESLVEQAPTVNCSCIPCMIKDRMLFS
jgi:hypothetical protein